MFNIKRKRKEDDLSYLERVYSRILKKDPNSFLYLPLASIFYHKGNLEKAIDALQKCLSIHSNYVTAKYYLAFLYRENGEVDKAVEIFKKVACDSQGHYAAHKALIQYYLDEKDEKSALIELRKLACLIPSGKAMSDSYLLVHDQIKKLEQNLKEDMGTLTSAEEDIETHISVKKDEKKVEKKKKNVFEIKKPQLKKQSEEKDDSLKGSDIIVCSLENWLKNINRIYEKT
tara:strand:- start:783 stop:1472 length:690 start_codon:yes stop_codon:yes gene_type:complete